jgi:protein gp37
MTKITWTDETVNPVAGCTKMSPGCDHCYALPMTIRQIGLGRPLYAGTVTDGPNRRWSGVVNYDGDLLRDKLLGRKKPKRIFVGSMADVFHRNVIDAWTADMWDVFWEVSNEGAVTVQLLTKRADRMRNRLWRLRYFGRQTPPTRLIYDPLSPIGYPLMGGPDGGKPLPRIWLGVTAENQDWYTRRANDLKLVSAAVRYLSCEPLLGPIDLASVNWEPDWVIVGQETGRAARACNPDWVHSLVDQCQRRNIPCFVKKSPGLRLRGGWPKQFPVEKEWKQ